MKSRLFFLIFCIAFNFLQLNLAQNKWSSKWVFYNSNETLTYVTDDKGNTIPDFSRVGYLEGENPPEIPVVLELEPRQGDCRAFIQAAIDELSARQADANGFKGCILLKKGVYNVSGQLTIASSGIVIRGEGNSEDGTVVVATGTQKYSLFKIQGSGSRSEISNSRVKVNMPFVPVGSKKIVVQDVSQFNAGDNIVLLRPGSNEWISDIQMDKIEPRSDGGTVVQWEAGQYNLHFERKVELIIGDTLYIENPVVMEMEERYGGAYVYRFTFNGRVTKCGIENLLLKSEYSSDTDENHAWDAVKIDKAIHCWVKDVVAKHFAYSAVNITSTSRNISVLNCKCLDAKSIITGGRRYSFNCDGQLNLFKNCETSDGRHDFITGARVAGPNVFTQCVAKNTHADIGPHHRWATGTLYDNIVSDGLIFVQDRGNYGTGHGWTGATQVLWNCRANLICVQSPWASGKNFAIGCTGVKSAGRHSNRPDGEWEGFNLLGLHPASLYEAQLANRKNISNLTNRNSYEYDLFTVIYNNRTFLITFNASVEGGLIELFNSTGIIVKSFKYSGVKRSVEIPFAGKGAYYLRFSSNNKIHSRKLFL